MLKLVRLLLVFVLLPVLLTAAAALAWLRWDAGRPLGPYFEARKGNLSSAEIMAATLDAGQVAEFRTLRSDAGLAVRVRIIRPEVADGALPVLIVLGGHRTGSDAVDLFGNVGQKAVVALDYPYDGPEKVRGIRQVLSTIPLARQAFIDTPPAVSLALDWITGQSWANDDELVIVGASLGVPFAALAAARDERVDVAMLVHGAADNRDWLETQVARRIDNTLLQGPLATIIHWLAYGPTFNTAANVAQISPRPVIIVGAREDERTPARQTGALFDAAGEPKLLRWTEGQHIEPDRADIIAELLALADELLPVPPVNR